MIRVNAIFFIISFCICTCFSEHTSEKTIITGDMMEIKNAGKVTVSKGHSLAVNKNSTINADEMSYDKENSLFSAKGNVRLSFKTQKLELLEVYSKYSNYNPNTQKGKVWGDVLIKYFVNNSTSPLLLRAKEVYVDNNNETLTANNNVVVVTSSGTIYADNGKFDKKTLGIIFKKDKKKPIAYVISKGNKGVYEADKIIFYNSKNDKKKIVMKGSVLGKIKMEDEKNDTKN